MEVFYVPRPVATLGLPPLCLMSWEYDCLCLCYGLTVRASLVFVPCSQTVLDMGLGMRVVPRFRGLRPALCYEGTT